MANRNSIRSGIDHLVSLEVEYRRRLRKKARDVSVSEVGANGEGLKVSEVRRTKKGSTGSNFNNKIAQDEGSKPFVPSHRNWATPIFKGEGIIISRNELIHLMCDQSMFEESKFNENNCGPDALYKWADTHRAPSCKGKNDDAGVRSVVMYGVELIHSCQSLYDLVYCPSSSESSLTLRQMVSVARQVAEAYRYLEALDIKHTDGGPTNILVQVINDGHHEDDLNDGTHNTDASIKSAFSSVCSPPLSLSPHNSSDVGVSSPQHEHYLANAFHAVAYPPLNQSPPTQAFIESGFDPPHGPSPHLICRPPDDEPLSPAPSHHEHPPAQPPHKGSGTQSVSQGDFCLPCRHARLRVVLIDLDCAKTGEMWRTSQTRRPLNPVTALGLDGVFVGTDECAGHFTPPFMPSELSWLYCLNWLQNLSDPSFHSNQSYRDLGLNNHLVRWVWKKRLDRLQKWGLVGYITNIKARATPQGANATGVGVPVPHNRDVMHLPPFLARGLSHLRRNGPHVNQSANKCHSMVSWATANTPPIIDMSYKEKSWRVQPHSLVSNGGSTDPKAVERRVEAFLKAQTPYVFSPPYQSIESLALGTDDQQRGNRYNKKGGPYQDQGCAARNQQQDGASTRNSSHPMWGVRITDRFLVWLAAAVCSEVLGGLDLINWASSHQVWSVLGVRRRSALSCEARRAMDLAIPVLLYSRLPRWQVEIDESVRRSSSITTAASAGDWAHLTQGKVSEVKQRQDGEKNASSTPPDSSVSYTVEKGDGPRDEDGGAGTGMDTSGERRGSKKGQVETKETNRADGDQHIDKKRHGSARRARSEDGTSSDHPIVVLESSNESNKTSWRRRRGTAAAIANMGTFESPFTESFLFQQDQQFDEVLQPYRIPKQVGLENTDLHRVEWGFPEITSRQLCPNSKIYPEASRAALFRVVNVLEKAMHFDPNRRHPNAHVFFIDFARALDDLEDALSEVEDVSAYPPPKVNWPGYWRPLKDSQGKPI
eukprot:GHVN01051498.1.p1 GENE.GHVN01051498.1~~GHVN01051498.1.p1  ORF type:complete len:1099 (-),score=266.51 GHVN01051498.1:1487-4462(-)